MKKTHIILLLSASISLLCGCNRTKPQSPRHKTPPRDTIQTALLLLNQRMAEEADLELMQYVNRQTENYTLDANGFWYKITSRTDLPQLQKEQNIRVKVRIFTLQDHLLSDMEEVICIGKKQVIPAIEEVLPLLCENETCLLLAPWYVAFGPVGSKTVPPYTNIKIELQTEKYN